MLSHQKIIGTIGYMGGIMSVPEPFAWSWGNMMTFTPDALRQNLNEHIHPARAKFSLHDYARHDLLRQMHGEWILMLDTDISFAPDLAARMVATMYRYNVDVVTGIYSYKRPPHYPVLYIHNKETDRFEIVADWDRESEIFQVSSAGAGCLLVKRHVFERITAELKENPFDRYGPKGEDHSFFIRLRKLGIKAWCAWKIEVDHLEYEGVKPSSHYVPDGNYAHTFDMEGMRESA
jgi:GT2 family glycosyltransferase